MINSIDANYAVNQASGQIRKTVSKTAVNAGVKAAEQTSETFSSTLKSGITGTAMYQGIPLVNFIKRAIKIPEVITTDGININTKAVLQNMDKNILESFKNIFKGKDGSFVQRFLNFLNQSEKNQKNFSNFKEVLSAQKSVNKIAAKGTEDVVKAAQKNLSGSVSKFINPRKYAAETVADLTKELKETSGFKKLFKSFELKNAVKNLDKLEKGAKSTSKLGKLMKSSGAKGMLILSGAVELFTEVRPAFKELGVKKGLKQLAKSAVKVVGDTFGYVAGSQLGTAAGSLAGAFAAAKIAAITGTAVAPGVGTVIGSLCGFACGLLGSWAVRKVISPFTKSERDIAKEQQPQVQDNPFAEFPTYELNTYLA